MGVMKNLASAVEELRSAAALITEVADELAQQLPEEAEPRKEPAKEAPVTAEPALKLEDVRAALAEISRAGHTAEVRTLLQKFGGTKLSEIDPANYRALLAEAGELNDEEPLPF